MAAYPFEDLVLAVGEHCSDLLLLSLRLGVSIFELSELVLVDVEQFIELLYFVRGVGVRRRSSVRVGNIAKLGERNVVLDLRFNVGWRIVFALRR